MWAKQVWKKWLALSVELIALHKMSNFSSLLFWAPSKSRQNTEQKRQERKQRKRQTGERGKERLREEGSIGFLVEVEEEGNK